MFLKSSFVLGGLFLFSSQAFAVVVDKFVCNVKIFENDKVVKENVTSHYGVREVTFPDDAATGTSETLAHFFVDAGQFGKYDMVHIGYSYKHKSSSQDWAVQSGVCQAINWCEKNGSCAAAACKQGEWKSTPIVDGVPTFLSSELSTVTERLAPNYTVAASCRLVATLP